MNLVKLMIERGATIPEVSEVLAASETLANPRSTIEELDRASATVNEAAERWDPDFELWGDE